MQRYGQLIRVKPDKLEEYKAYHANVWPEILAMIRECNIHNYSIYFKDGYLFAYFEYVGADFAATWLKWPPTQNSRVVGRHDAMQIRCLLAPQGSGGPTWKKCFTRTEVRTKDENGKNRKLPAKLNRMNKNLRHEEADRVPISDFFWGSFLERWRRTWGCRPIWTLTDTTTGLDCHHSQHGPHIKQFEILKETDEDVVVRTGSRQPSAKSLQTPCLNGWASISIRLKKPRLSSSTTRGMSGVSSAREITRSPASAMVLPATRQPGSRPSSLGTRLPGLRQPV